MNQSGYSVTLSIFALRVNYFDDITLIILLNDDKLLLSERV